MINSPLIAAAWRRDYGTIERIYLEYLNCGWGKIPPLKEMIDEFNKYCDEKGIEFPCTK